MKQYQTCEQILRKELGIDQQPETRDLYKKIRKREIKPIQVEKQNETKAPLHNLPMQLSTFIGREKEQKLVARLITSHRLVTLIGAGGIGKTRLSLKVGQQLLGQVVLREGNMAEADTIFAETTKDFQKDGNTIGTVFGLEGMSSLFVMIGKSEQAARLIGWADAIHEQIPDIRPLIEQADIDRSIAAILAKIGPSAFEIAYDEVRSMTLEEAVALALES